MLNRHILFVINIHALCWVHLPGFDSLTLESHCRPCLICEVMVVILLSLQCFQTSWRAKGLFTGASVKLAAD